MDEEVSGNIVEGLAGGLTKRVKQVQQASRQLSKAIQINTGRGTDALAVGSTGGVGTGSSYDGYGAATTNLYMDGRVVASATSRVQYSKNNTRARSLGVVPV